MALTLSLLADEYAVSQLPADAPLPTWATAGEFWSLSRTPQEWSAVCLAAQVPAGVRSERGWAAFALQGPFDFGLTGVLASVLNPLRDAGIGIFALSTFDTDYVLVKQADLAGATRALEEAGHRVLR